MLTLPAGHMDWNRAVYLTLDWIWALGGTACLILAAACVLRPGLFAALERRLDSPPFRGRRAPAAVWGLGFSSLIAAFKLAQFYSYQSMWDSGIIANVAWNALHGYGLHSSVIADRSYLSVHFAFTVALLSPVLWLWNSAAALALIQGLAVGSSILAIHLLVRHASKDALAPWLASLLGLSHPYYQANIGAVLDNSVYALPAFLWCAYLWESGRGAAAAAPLLLLLSTREQAPFVLAGIGLYLLYSSKGRGRYAAAGLVAASALIWTGEIAAIQRAQAGYHCIDNWALFNALGGSKEAVLRLAFHEPWRFALALVYPPAKLWTPARALLYTGFLPLASGAAILPVLAAWLPNQLAAAGSGYNDLNAHASAFMLGPLLWACAKSLGRLARSDAAPRRRFVLVHVLCFAALGLLGSGRSFYYTGQVPSSWRATAPKAFAHVPPAASVWCDDFFLPHLGLRRYVKTLPRSLPDCCFDRGLFLPDRVVLSLHWARLADPASRGRMLGFLKAHGFLPVFQENDLVVLANPSSRGDGKDIPKPAVIP